LEANLRVVQKAAETTTETLSASVDELETLRASLDDMEQTLEFRDTELDTMRQAVKQESKKVVELRRELTDHAEETIRATIIARDSETELSVLKAGASVVFDEVNRHESERDELTNRLQAVDEGSLNEPMAGNPGIVDPGIVDLEDDEADQTGRQADEYMPDC